MFLSYIILILLAYICDIMYSTRHCSFAGYGVLPRCCHNVGHDISRSNNNSDSIDAGASGPRVITNV